MIPLNQQNYNPGRKVIETFISIQSYTPHWEKAKGIE